MCDCWAKVEANLTELLSKQTGASEKDIVQNNLDGLRFHIINNKLEKRLSGFFSFHYYKRKKNGDRAKNPTKAKFPINYNYCPFCGEAIK